jgi:hypothetical protein
MMEKQHIIRNKKVYLGLAVIIGFVFFYFLFVKPGEKVEVYFSPFGGIQDLIISKINSAQSKIDVAMYAFTNEELAFALVRANNRGIETRVILDGRFIENEFSKDEFLYDRGIRLKVNVNNIPGTEINYGRMHHKFAIIDDKVVITGSYNWTSSAEKNNYENLLIFPDSRALVRIYEKEFKKLWERGIHYRRIKESSLNFPIISALDLKNLKEHKKRMVKVRGTVNNVYHSKGSNTYFLHFGPDRSSFSAVIFSSTAKKFLDQGLDPRNYEGKKIEILGQVIDHPKYGLEMILKDPSQIMFMTER